jgi:diguanylate cyclase (GGDEF)-like protein/PAS domain S-box-containing protein
MRERTNIPANGKMPQRNMIPACVLVFLLCPLLGISQARNSSVRHRTLRTLHDVFALSKAEAVKAYPIELDAVVTYSDPEWGLLFVQDQTGTTFIDVHGSNIVYPLAARVRVQAVTDANENGIAMAHPKIMVLGQGTLPQPDRRSVAELDAGAGEAHRAVTEGVLHPCDRDWNRVCFRLYDGEKLVWLMIPQQDNSAAQSLLGATVRVKGMVARHEDEEKKRVGAQLYVDALEDIEVESPPSPVSIASSPTPIGKLRVSDADPRFVHQIHVRGTVTWQSPGLFCIQDGSGTLFVGTGKTASVTAGSTVDAIGFLSHGVFGLLLGDSAVRLAEIQPDDGRIAPLRLTAAEVVQRSLNGRRVRIKARLIGQSASATEFVYQLEDGSQRFNAVLLRNDATREVVGLSRDSVLDVTGVALIQNGTAEWPGALLILVESPKDIVLIRGGEWLTLKQRLAIGCAMAFFVTATLAWVTLLRRTVRKQTAIIRARLENELQLETKFRRLFERNLAAVFSWRSDGAIVDCNMAFVNLLGLRSREELIGRSYWDFQADPAHREQLCGDLQEEALSNRDVSLRRDDGVTVHLLTNITPVQTAEGMLYETTAIDVTQLRQNQAELQRAKDAAVFDSLNDPLTGLPNRRLLLDTLSSMLGIARSEGGMIALLYIDLDGFKLVNDSLGHPIGDALLVQMAACLRSWIREGDILGRLGGDEFMVILDRLHDKEDAALVAENLLDAISNPFKVEGHDLKIGASIGISIFPECASDAAEFMKQADSAMYAAKRAGKNRVMSFTPEIGSLVHERLSLEILLRGAIARHEISVQYQPEFELAGSRLIRFEALARWTHPTLGSIRPDKFIPIAEESGLIDVLGAFIMEQACTEAVRWQGIVQHPIQVAVNVSSIQFRRKGFVEEVCMILGRSGLKPELLQIELTESVMLSGAHFAAETMNRLHALGISLAIDDFGTGYSNLSYLPSLPFDAVKIDRSFVMNMETQPESESMIRTVIALAKNIGMRAIVEGIETTQQLELVKAFGANEVQGYLTGRPTSNPIEDFLNRVDNDGVQAQEISQLG